MSHFSQIQNWIQLLENAIITIDQWYEQYIISPNLLMRDGFIQRSEYTIELFWKTCKKVLEYQLVEFSPTPLETIKTSAKIGLISDAQTAIQLLKIRNHLSHTYDAIKVNELFDQLIAYRSYYHIALQEIKIFTSHLQ